jgi:hypothetical protein
MNSLALFEEKQVRRAWNQAGEKWYFAIVDVIAILTSSDNPHVYWRVMKKRLSDEGNETVTNCNALKMTAADGKQRLGALATLRILLRQSVWKTTSAQGPNDTFEVLKNLGQIKWKMRISASKEPVSEAINSLKLFKGGTAIVLPPMR